MCEGIKEEGHSDDGEQFHVSTERQSAFLARFQKTGGR